jgi:hypothetical protein
MRLAFIIGGGTLVAITAITAFMLMSVSEPPQSITPPSREEAIAKAEAFVRAQGYTDKPASVGPGEIAYEGIERGATDAEKLSFRRGTLLPTAVGATQQESGTWTVGFQYQQPTDPNLGRGVIVPADGSPLRIVHQDLFLSSLNTK